MATLGLMYEIQTAADTTLGSAANAVLSLKQGRSRTGSGVWAAASRSGGAQAVVLVAAFQRVERSVLRPPEGELVLPRPCFGSERRVETDQGRSQ
jgi:hypothetical protein